MKKILILIVLSLGYLLGYSQFPITQSIGSPKTKVVNKGIFYSDSAIIVTGYTDTTQANLGYIKNIPHVIIATSNDIWIRNIAATAWLQLVNIGSGATDTLAWRLSGNNATGMGGTPVMGTISYTDFNFATNNLKRFGISKDGIQDSTVNVVNLGIDTTTGYLSYARAGGGGGGSGTVTSVATNTGTGLRGGTITGAGTLFNDTLILATRAWRQKGVDSLLALIGAKPSGSGTTDYLARWTNSTTLGIGATRDDGSSVGIGTAPSGVAGSISIASRLYIPYYAGSTGGIYVNGLKWGKADVNGNNVIGFNSGSDSATATGNAIFGNGSGGRVNGFGNVLLGDEVAPTMAGYDGSLAGSRNIFIGYQAGKFAVKPSHNISIGTGSGQNADSALSNIWIGKGTGAGTRNSVGDVFLGSSINYTGTYNSLGFNAVVGADAFLAPTTARYNSIIGGYAGQGLTSGRENLLAGYNAGASYTDAIQNTSLGAYAAYLQTGSLNVHIGYLADAYNATAYSRKLFINTKGDGGDVALIGGDGNSGQVAINKTIAQIADDAANFQVHGTSHFDSTVIIDDSLIINIPTKGAGKVLTSDANGTATWQTPTGGSGSGIESLGTTGAYGLVLVNDSTYRVDTLAIATRAWRQKGMDSLLALITGGVTSIGVTTANGVSGTSSGGTTPSLTITLGAITPTSVAATSFVRAPYLYGGDMGTTYPTYSGGVLGGTATGGVLDFVHNNSRIGEFFTTSGAFNFFTDVSKDLNFYVNSSLSVPALGILSTGNVGIGLTTPTAGLHLKAGTTTLAPFKLNTGTALTTPEDGAIEYHGSHLYFTVGSTRYQLDQQVNADSVTTKWSTLGNTLTGTGKFGTLSNHGYNFITNDVVRGGFTSAGAFSTTQDVIFNGIYFGQGPVNGLSHIRIGDATTLRDITAGSLLNTGIGISALKQTTTGDFNLAVGYTALEKNTTGSDQNAFGRQAGQNNVGDRNLFLGGASGVNCLTCTYQIHVENSNGTGNGVATGRYNIILANSVANLSPSLHNSIVIADSVDIVIMKDSSGKMYINAPNTIIGSQGVGNSTLQSAGSFSAGYVAKTANYTATISDYTINCTANTFQVTLPTAVGCAGRIYVVTNSGAGTITVGTTSSQTFANVVATPTTLTMAAVGSRTVQSDGANWLLLSSL